jgi:hypothetical protein
MSAKQLTSFDRTAIATEILSRRFKPEFEKIEKREHAFARKMPTQPACPTSASAGCLP